jgi:hypothetical protein
MSSSTYEVSPVITIAINTLLFGFILLWITTEINRGRKSTGEKVVRRLLPWYLLRWIALGKLRWLLSRKKTNSSTADDFNDNKEDSITVSNIFIYPGNKKKPYGTHRVVMFDGILAFVTRAIHTYVVFNLLLHFSELWSKQNSKTIAIARSQITTWDFSTENTVGHVWIPI